MLEDEPEDEGSSIEERLEGKPVLLEVRSESEEERRGFDGGAKGLGRGLGLGLGPKGKGGVPAPEKGGVGEAVGDGAPGCVGEFLSDGF